MPAVGDDAVWPVAVVRVRGASCEALGYEPRVGFADGMAELCAWIAEEAPPAEDKVARSTSELEQRGLVI